MCQNGNKPTENVPGVKKPRVIGFIFLITPAAETSLNIYIPLD